MNEGIFENNEIILTNEKNLKKNLEIIFFLEKNLEDLKLMKMQSLVVK
jgi:hypothetical protein